LSSYSRQAARDDADAPLSFRVPVVVLPIKCIRYVGNQSGRTFQQNHRPDDVRYNSPGDRLGFGDDEDFFRCNFAVATSGAVGGRTC
jgi:hypothetical protein